MKNNKWLGVVPVAILVISYILFIIALCIQNILLSGIASGLVFMSLVVSLLRTLFQKQEFALIDILELFFNFISTVAFVIVFVYLIPDRELKDITVPIVASVLGGLLTLAGVGLTVKYSRIEKEKEEINKNKPVVFPISYVTWGNLEESKRTTIYVEVDRENSELKPSNDKKNKYSVQHILLSNSDLSLSSLYGILVNDRLIKFKYEQILLKNSCNIVFIDKEGYDFSVPEGKVESVSLLLSDILGNLYEMIVRYKVEDNNNITFNASTGIKRCC